MNAENPWDQRMRLIHALVSQAVSRDEAEELELPHIVICHDPDTGRRIYSGPFPNALAALAYAEHESRLDQADPEDPLLEFSVAALHPPEPSDP